MKTIIGLSNSITLARTISKHLHARFLSIHVKHFPDGELSLRLPQKLSGHVIICGYGRNGRQAAHVLKKHDRRFVVIEDKKEIVDAITNNGATVQVLIELLILAIMSNQVLVADVIAFLKTGSHLKIVK